jgi:phage-related protein
MGNDVFGYPVMTGSSGQMAQRSLKAQYGDGYTQLARDGINTRSDTWNLTARGVWDDTVMTCANTGQPVREIADFINDHAGQASFKWVAPDGLDAQWMCDGYSISKDGRQIVTLTFTFYRTYTP